MTPPSPPIGYRNEQSEEAHMISRVDEDPLPPVAARGDVVDAIRNQYARRTRHNQTVRVALVRMAIVVTFGSNSFALFDMAGVRPRTWLFWPRVAV
jgi:hypothetical protein